MPRGDFVVVGAMQKDGSITLTASVNVDAEMQHEE
jgi:hypothetical protein